MYIKLHSFILVDSFDFEKFIFMQCSVDGINCLIWKRRVSYLLILDKTYYVTVTEKPSATDEISKKQIEKWEENNEFARAACLSPMQDALILLFEDKKMAKEILGALEKKYGGKYDTYVQLLLENYNGLSMSDSSVVGHVNHMAFVTKDLLTIGNPISDKMPVSTILNILPPFLDSVVTTINCSGQDLTIDS